MKVAAVEETHMNESKGYLLGDPIICSDPFTDDPGELFRHCQKEYGRCQSRVYIDTDEGTKAVGWVFSKRRQYEDTAETYIHEVWVTLLAAPDEVTRKRTYYEVSLG